MGQTAEQVRLDLTFLLRQEGPVWTALCLELDIASCGATEAEALESLQGLVELYLDDCLSQGEYPIPLRPVPCEVLQSRSPPLAAVCKGWGCSAWLPLCGNCPTPAKRPPG